MIHIVQPWRPMDYSPGCVLNTINLTLTHQLSKAIVIQTLHLKLGDPGGQRPVLELLAFLFNQFWLRCIEIRSAQRQPLSLP